MASRVILQTLRPAFVAPQCRVWRSALNMRAMSGEGGITSALMEQMRSKIQDSLDAQRVEVADVQGDGRHVEIVVVSKEFEGKSAVNRQRLVYKAIWEELQNTVHAVDAMVTQTPDEAGLS